MNTLKKILLAVMILLAVLFTGCAFHAETSMGAGSGSKYAASMSGRRGAGIDFPADSTSVSSKTEKSITRAARD